MGNQVGVCREPPQLAELFPLHDESSQTNGNDHMQDDGGFRSYIQMWRFYSDNGDDMFIKNSPVKLGAFKKFDSRDCYIALHIFKNIGDTNNKHAAINTHNSTPDTPYSLHELVISSIEELTPRGIASSFGTLSLEPFIHTSREEYTHDLYVWNGKASTPLAKAVALAKGFEIERVLVKEKSSSGTVYHRFASGPKSSLSSIFRDDIDEAGGRNQSDVRRYDMNHLFKQLLSPYKRATTIKIGELFGNHQADSPRFEVLRKSIHKFEPGTSTSPSVPRNTKVPSLPLHALPPPSQQQQLDDATPRPKVPPIFVKAHTEGSITVPSFTRRMTLSFDNLKDPTEYNEDDYSTWEPSKLLTRFEPLLSQILDFLYLSSRVPTADKPMLKTNGITHILNCAGNACTNHFPDDFVYKTYFISDSSGEDIMCLFYETIDFIEEARLKGGKILVHCHQGVSRSSSFVILYLMWQFRWDFNKAHEWVRAIRYISNPNPGFTGQLILWFNMITKLPSRPRLHAIPAPAHPPPSAVPPSLVLTTPRSSVRNGEPISTPRGHREPPPTPRSISFDSAIATRSHTPGSPTPTPNFSIDPTPTPRGEPPVRFHIPAIPISSIPTINAPQVPTLPTQKVTPLHFNLSTPTPGEPPPHRRSNDSPPSSPTLYLHQPKTLTRTASDPTPSSSASPPNIPPPTKLFRMVSHSQNSFVAPKTVAEPFTCRALDPRGCFALCTPTVVFVWYGARCPSALAEGARRAVDKLQRFEFAASSVEDVRQGHEPPAFWACVPGGSGEVVENPAYREYLQVGAQSPGRRELAPATNGSPERAQFYKYLEDKDSWDRYECFDLEDLDSEGMFVVYVQQPRHIWVWIGGDYAGRWGIDGESVDGLLVARQFRNFLALSDEGDVTIIKHVQQETEEFMSNFHWGDTSKKE